MSSTATSLDLRVDLPEGWSVVDRDHVGEQLGVLARDPREAHAARTLARSLRAASDRGVVLLATHRGRFPGLPRPLVAGLAVTARRADELPGVDHLALTAALRQADRARATVLRPLELPHGVQLWDAEGVRRGAIMRVPGPGGNGQGVVLEDRFAWPVGPVLLVADFLTPEVGLHLPLRRLFQRIAETIRVAPEVEVADA